MSDVIIDYEWTRRVVALLKEAISEDVNTGFHFVQNEWGTCTFCEADINTINLKGPREHEPGCWVLRARAALASCQSIRMGPAALEGDKNG